MSRLQLIAYDLHAGYWDHGATILPSKATRDWFPQFAYRCTPMVIANQYGWNILCPTDISVTWNGEGVPKAVTIEPEDSIGIGHFGSGILTFQIPYLFHTPKGWSLFVRGPINEPKDGISPLEGIVETDTTIETFTMNWKFTRPGTVSFSEGETLCTIYPIPRNQLQKFVVKIKPIETNTELQEKLTAWSASRDEWNAGGDRSRRHGDYVKRIDESHIKLKKPKI